LQSDYYMVRFVNLFYFLYIYIYVIIQCCILFLVNLNSICSYFVVWLLLCCCCCYFLRLFVIILHCLRLVCLIYLKLLV
jgi:hypothetical protein